MRPRVILSPISLPGAVVSDSEEEAMIRRPTVVWIATAISALALSGCYTLLQAPGFASQGAVRSTTEAYTWDADDASVSPRVGDFDDSDHYPYGYGPRQSAGVPVLGYDSLYGLYGFGSPYAYGPYGGLYSGGYGYGSNAGPYGYGYDPYYQDSRGAYIPPGYQLITTESLDTLVRNQGQGVGSISDPLSDAERATQVRSKQRQAERAWTQRTQPERKTTSAVRTTRPAASSGRVTTSSTSSSTTSSSSESSGSSAAKRRKKKR
jgi:hypothetical protein